MENTLNCEKAWKTNLSLLILLILDQNQNFFEILVLYPI
jgi:hypothetical protein